MDTLTDGTPSAALRDVIGELSCYLDDVSADLFGKLTDAEVLAELHEFEMLRRRLAVIDHALVAELGRRALPGRLVMASTSALLQAALRLSPHEANQRANAAEVCGPRWSLTGSNSTHCCPTWLLAKRLGWCLPSRPG